MRRPATPAPSRELRRFGLVMTLAFGGLGTLLLFRGPSAAPFAFAVAAVFLVTGLALPRILDRVHRVWMRLAAALSTVTTFLVLTVAFLVLVTPLGLVRRLLRKDPLGLRFQREASTYWVPVEPDGPGSRPHRPF